MLRRASRPVALLAAAVLVPTAGCTGGPDDRAAGGVTIGISAPRSLLPTDTVDIAGTQVLSALFEPLVTFDSNGMPVPAAAESVTTDRSARVWTIKLRAGLTFHNGEPVTSDSYIKAWNYGAFGPNGQRGGSSFERIDGYVDLQSRDPDGPTGPEGTAAPPANTLRGLRKVDDTTFTVTLSGPFAAWASLLNGAAFYPLPEAAFREPGVIADEYRSEVVGNGPFAMTEPWRDDPEIRMRRAAGHRAPSMEAVTWKIYRDPGAAYDDLVAGDLDVLPQIPPDRLIDATQRLGDRLGRSGNSTLTFLSLPVRHPAFAGRDVRRALSLAIDRPRLAGLVTHGAETAATAFVAPVVPGYRPDACTHCTHDPGRAKAMYTAAGGPPNITIAHLPGHRGAVDEVCRQLTAALGIGCTGAGRDSAADLLIKAENRQAGDLTRLSWTMNYPLMENYLDPIYGTDGSVNVHGYSNPAFDSLVRQGSAARTPAAAVAKWQAAEDVLAHDMPVIPLFFGQNVSGHSKRVTSVAVDPAQRVEVRRLRLLR